MDYFKGYETPEAIKARHKELARRLHPDAGGSAEAFQEMQRQYAVKLQKMGDKARTREEWQPYIVLLADFLNAAAPKVAQGLTEVAGTSAGEALMGALPENVQGLVSNLKKNLRR